MLLLAVLLLPFIFVCFNQVNAQPNFITFSVPQMFSNPDIQVIVLLSPNPVVYGKIAYVSFDVAPTIEIYVNQFTVELNSNVRLSQPSGSSGPTWSFTWSNMTMYRASAISTQTINGVPFAYLVSSGFLVQTSPSTVGYVNGRFFANYTVNGENRTFSQSSFSVFTFPFETASPMPSPSPSLTPSSSPLPTPTPFLTTIAPSASVPEFPTWIILPLMATAVTTVVYFKKRKSQEIKGSIS